MKKIALPLACLLLLTGCGKKEVDAPAVIPEPEITPAPVSDVTPAPTSESDLVLPVLELLGWDYKAPHFYHENYVEPLVDLSSYVDENGRLTREPLHLIPGKDGAFNPVHKPMKIMDNCYVSGQFMCEIVENDLGYIEEVAPSREAFIASLEDFVPYRISEIECRYYGLTDIADSLYDSEMKKNPYIFYYLGQGHWGAYWPEYEEIGTTVLPQWHNGYMYHYGSKYLDIDFPFWHSGEFTGLDFDVKVECAIDEGTLLSLLDVEAGQIELPNPYAQYRLVNPNDIDYKPDNVEALKTAGFDILYALMPEEKGLPVHVFMTKDGTVYGYDTAKQYEVPIYE